MFSGWWLNQPIWKICSSNGIIFPNRDEKKKCLSCHHLVLNLLNMKESRYSMVSLIPRAPSKCVIDSEVPRFGPGSSSPLNVLEFTKRLTARALVVESRTNDQCQSGYPRYPRYKRYNERVKQNNELADINWMFFKKSWYDCMVWLNVFDLHLASYGQGFLFGLNGHGRSERLPRKKCHAAIFCHDANLSESQVTQSHIWVIYAHNKLQKGAKTKKTGSNINTHHINIYHTCARSLTCLSLKKMLMSGEFMKVIPIQCWCLACGLLPQTPGNAIHNQQNIMDLGGQMHPTQFGLVSVFTPVHPFITNLHVSVNNINSDGFVAEEWRAKTLCDAPFPPIRRPSPAAPTFGHRRRE